MSLDSACALACSHTWTVTPAPLTISFLFGTSISPSSGTRSHTSTRGFRLQLFSPLKVVLTQSICKFLNFKGRDCWTVALELLVYAFGLFVNGVESQFFGHEMCKTERRFPHTCSRNTISTIECSVQPLSPKNANQVEIKIRTLTKFI